MSKLSIIESDSVIVSMTRASQALAEAVTIGQTKTLIDVAHAAEIYSKRHHLSDEAIGRALSVKVDATRKLGEILMTTPKAKGEILRGNKMEPRRISVPTLEELGLSKKESAVAQKLAALPEKQFEQVRLGNITIAKAIAAVDAKPKDNPIAATREKPIKLDEEGAPDKAEFDSVAAAEKAEQMSMRLLLASDEPLADMTAKYEQALIQVERLNARIVGLQNQSMHQIKTIKSLQNKVKKLEQPA
jgi:flagellin-like hook-associated protein FlgL